MPILDLQRRMRQLGEIRIGHVVSGVSKSGKAYTRPAKLDKFRFTSPSRAILASVATLYGGEVQPWTPANGGPSEFEVYSTTDRLPVLIPPHDAVSQWYELYAGSKCQRRCDGVTEQKSDRPCLCDPERRQCARTTRVNVMLRDVPALGQWLLITKGYYAAVTLPPAAELLAQAGGYIPGWLGMEEKTAIVGDKPARFMIPTLDVEITPAALMAGQAGPALTAPAAPAVEGGGPAALGTGRPNYAQLARISRDAQAVREIWRTANGKGHMTPELSAELKAIADGFEVSDEAGESGWEPDPEEEVVVPELVDDDDPTEVWFQIIAAAGARGWTTEDVEMRFAAVNDGLMPSSATTPQLVGFLAAIKAGEVV